jgi:NADH:ubiquinone oxidoreductase subunit E
MFVARARYFSPMEEIMAIQQETRKGIIAICNEYKGEPSPLMPILEKIQKNYGYIPLEVQELVSQEMDIPVAEIYGVVTFYNFFSLTPKGKYVVGVCLGTACYVKNSQAIIEKFESLLGIKPGETTDDGLFTIEAIRCMGACALAPAVSVNGKVYPQVKVDQVAGIVDEYKKQEANA